MISLKTRVFQLGAILTIGGLTACQLFNRHVPITKIGDIQKNWQGYSEVYLQGKTGDRAPFVGSGAYELEDATGKIWVITSQPLPQPGERVLLKGQVQDKNISAGGKEVGEVYIQEREQLERQPVEKTPDAGK
jgi:hypothetical protein